VKRDTGMKAETRKNLLVSLAAVVLFFAVFEATLRIFYISSAAELYAPDAELERKLAPSHHALVRARDFEMVVQTNALGLRDAEVGEKRPGVKRVLVLGDSYPFGYGVKQAEAFPARLEESLQSRGKTVEVINAGVFGWGPDQELIWLRREGVKLKPDVVVIAFYVGNDAIDSFTKKFFVVEEGKLKRVKPLLSGEELNALEFRSFLRKNFLVYAFLSEQVRTILAARAASGEGVALNEFEMLRKDYSPDIEAGMEVSQAVVAEMARVSREAGAEPLLVVIPTQMQYDGEKWEAVRRQFGLESNGFDLEKPDQALQGFARGQGLAVLDLLPALKEARQAGALNLPVDGHWNAAGHEVAAEALASALAVQGMV